MAPILNCLNVAGADHSSVCVRAGPPSVSPPEANPEVAVPAPLIFLFAVPRSATSVQEVPSQDSVLAIWLGSTPPKIKAYV